MFETMSQTLSQNTNWELFFGMLETVFETVSHTHFVKTVKTLTGRTLSFAFSLTTFALQALGEGLSTRGNPP